MHRKESKLLTAAKNNKYDDLRKIFDKIDKAKNKRKLKENIDIDVKDSSGTTALHYAAKHGNIEMMVYLVARGACIESIDKNGWRPLSYACANNHINAVKTLIEWKSNVNKFSLMEENSPLHIAAGFGYIDIVKVLMEHGAIVHYQNKKKQTAMDVACENNHYGKVLGNPQFGNHFTGYLMVVNVLLTASSKLIEDTSEKNMASNNFSQSIPSSLSRSSLFIKSPSVNIAHNIHPRIKSDFQRNGNFEYKRRTIGSQCQLNVSPDKPKPQKSESLNTVFLNDKLYEEYNRNRGEHGGQETPIIKSNLSEIEVNLPYPSKFSSSGKMKIKSPLLASKNWKLDKKNQLINPNIKNSFNSDQCSAQFIYPAGQQTSPSIITLPPEMFFSISHPLSSCKLQKNNSGEQTSTYSINNLYAVSRNDPHNSPSSKSSTDADSASNSHFRKFQSVRRGFGSESDIVDSSDKIKRSKSTSKSKKAFQDSVLTQNEENPPLGPTDEYTCCKWIKNLGLERIWDTLFKEGFDSFLALSLASNEELLLLCDNNIEDLDCLKTNLDSLNIPLLKKLNFSNKISDFLFQLGLECYINNFNKNGYIYVHQTIGFEETDLNKLQIYKIGHRKLILKSLSILNNNKININNECNTSQTSNGLIPKNASPRMNIYDELKYFVDIQNSPIFKNEDENENLIEDLEIKENGFESSRKDAIETNHSSIILSKKPPPPIPFRTSSFMNIINTDNITLQDIISPSDSEKKKILNKPIPVDQHSTDPSCLDDLVNLLQNLGKELENELNSVSV